MLLPAVPFNPGCDEKGNVTEESLAAAAAAAKQANIAVVCAGLPDIYESEGFDRETMAMPEGHNRLIETVAAANPNTVVVLFCGCAVETPWLDKVKAVLYMGLPGQAGGGGGQPTDRQGQSQRQADRNMAAVLCGCTQPRHLR